MTWITRQNDGLRSPAHIRRLVQFRSSLGQLEHRDGLTGREPDPSAEFGITRKDDSGGSGANFMRADS